MLSLSKHLRWCLITNFDRLSVTSVRTKLQAKPLQEVSILGIKLGNANPNKYKQGVGYFGYGKTVQVHNQTQRAYYR